MLVTGVWVGFDQPRTIMPNGFAGDVAVPMWATFMKGGDHGDKPEWFTPPAGVTTATVCRLSGKLADRRVRARRGHRRQGLTSTRSMVYREYFAKGTVPKQRCDLHPTRGFFGAWRPCSAASDEPIPPRLADTGAPATPPPARRRRLRPLWPRWPLAPPEQPKKRGFWGRLFGRRDKAEDDKRSRRAAPSRRALPAHRTPPALYEK